MAFKNVIASNGAKFPEAMEKVTQEKDCFLASPDFRAMRQQHVRVVDPVGSTLARVRHRPACSWNCLSQAGSLGLAFNLMGEAEKSRRTSHGVDRIRPDAKWRAV
ncbi:MAG: hypothetical protein NVSMB6_12680 [Burkholderiaceae bacterium]